MLLARCLHLKQPPCHFARHLSGKPWQWIDPSLITFKPETLVSLRQPPVDFSNLKSHNVLGVTLRYGTDITTRKNFPADTSGFLYYQPGSTKVAGQLRLRICDDASSFDAGRDLLVDNFQPWGMNLVNLVRNPSWAPIVDRLVQENLVSRNAVETMRALLADTGTRAYTHHINTLSDPFYIYLDNLVFHLHVVTEKHHGKYVFLHLFSTPYRDRRLGNPLPNTSPFTGMLKVRFELSKLREHASLGPTLVLKILEGHNVQHVRKDITYVKEPVAGGYHYRLPHGKLKMWRLRLDKNKGARDLFSPLLDLPGIVYAE